jgi:hypothetical protein
MRIIISILTIVTIISCSTIESANSEVFMGLDNVDIIKDQMHIDSAEMSLIAIISINLFLEDQLPVSEQDIEKIEIKRKIKLDTEDSPFNSMNEEQMDYLKGPFLEIVYKPLIDSTLKQWSFYKGDFDSISFIQLNDSSMFLFYDKKPKTIEAYRINLSRKWSFIHGDSLDLKLKHTRLVLYDTLEKDSVIINDTMPETKYLKFN